MMKNYDLLDISISMFFVKPRRVVLSAFRMFPRLLATFATVVICTTSPIQAQTPECESNTDINAIVDLQDDTNGSWPEDWNPDTDPAPDRLVATSQALIQLIQHAKEPEPGCNYESPFDTAYIHHEYVENGFDYLLSHANQQAISAQDGRNPDTDSDGFGICLNCGLTNENIATSNALLAVCNAVDLDHEVTSGALSAKSYMYEEVAIGLIDYLAFSQIDDGPERGSWGPMANSSSETNIGITGVVDTALKSAATPHPEGCGLDVPAFVQEERQSWFANLGSDGPTPPDPTDFDDMFKYCNCDDRNKRCDQTWSDTDRRGGGEHGYPVCYQMLEDFEVDIVVSYFGSQLFNYHNLPVVPDPRRFGSIYMFYKGEGDKMLEHAKRMPPNDATIDAGEYFLKLEPGGKLLIRKGYRWDGPTPPGKVAKPWHFEQTLMRASLVHDALYDLMRMGELARDDNLIPVWGWNRLGEWNRLIADNLFYMIGYDDLGWGFELENLWFWIRFGGWANTKEKKLDGMPWKKHAVADAGDDQLLACTDADGTQVTLDSSRSQFADKYIWHWTSGSGLPMSRTIDETTLALDFAPGNYDVILEADCAASQSSDCDATYFKDFDGVRISVIEDQPPVISSQGDITVTVPPDRVGANVKYNVSATDDCSTPTMSCNHPSGSLFRMGSTPVQCTAEDSAGQTETVAFDVTVKVDESIHWRQPKVGSGSMSWPTLLLLSTFAALSYVRARSRKRIRQRG